jgi:amino acid adenylation domain-containing protein
MRSSLHSLLDASVLANPDKTAMIHPGHGEITYRDLGRVSDLLRDRLQHEGVRVGDRVGICLHKSIDSIAALFGILKAGAAYVPVDPDAPPARRAFILMNCAVRAVICERALVDDLRAELERLGDPPSLHVVDEVPEGIRLAAYLEGLLETDPISSGTTEHPAPDGVAYILYTSGSTGLPKGVTISHRAARAFVDWCSATFCPRGDDVFSSHAPLHFDLSIHDIYVSLKHGATLVLIGEELGKDPHKLASEISSRRISVWYSTPSILSLLAQYGKLDRYDYSALRIVHFAGEVFPIPQFRRLHGLWPHPRYFNLYGPTETNVCTYHEVRALEPDRVEPFPIGRLCAHYQGRVVDSAGNDVPAGEEGELVCAGPGVMSGYWDLPEQNARAFLVDASGTPWYRTGDLVVEQSDVGYIFHGRRDRMVKRRGYRIELGEIEAALATHPQVRENAVIAMPDDASGVRIKAFLSFRQDRPSIIQLKQYCVERLPSYMVPDLFGILERLPRTSTGKVDYEGLKSLG